MLQHRYRCTRCSQRKLLTLFFLIQAQTRTGRAQQHHREDLHLLPVVQVIRGVWRGLA
jgi:hypothetical protein